MKNRFMLPAIVALAALAAGAGLWRPAPSTAQTTVQDYLPRGHFEVSDPARIDANRAEAIYQGIRERLDADYAQSRVPQVADYQKWFRASLKPYPSATHGALYVNNYANRAAAAYGAFEAAGTLPAGAVIAKDSFSVTRAGRVFPGPLFVMEKMPAGFHPPSGHWKYSMIMPDGSLFGVTNGTGSENVGFCVGCHAAQADRDHLFFVPEAVRATALPVPPAR
jgi:hypothetical protein